MTISCAVVGYGPAFNMGKAHASWMQKTKGLELNAICDIDESRTKAAEEDFPGVLTFNKLEDLLEEDFDLAAVVTPHNVHHPLAMKCLEAGRSVIVEKPMCVTVDEATDMINQARKSKVMLSVFHNRRWDGDFMALKEAIDKGLIGKVYQIEAFAGGYGHPGKWWRSNKKISGGAMYDWGAHFLDWILNLVPDKMTGIVGFSQKLVWKDVTNEDDVRAIIKFKSGATADFQQSSIAMAGKPKWRILGTKGAIVNGDKCFNVSTFVRGIRAQMNIGYKESDWDGYYRNISEHLNKGKELVVKPEEARRVIAVMETAEKSWKSGKMEEVPYE